MNLQIIRMKNIHSHRRDMFAAVGMNAFHKTQKLEQAIESRLQEISARFFPELVDCKLNLAINVDRLIDNVTQVQLLNDSLQGPYIKLTINFQQLEAMNPFKGEAVRQQFYDFIYAHELQHVLQFHSKRILYKRLGEDYQVVEWVSATGRRKDYKIHDSIYNKFWAYNALPWETEANNRAVEVVGLLYGAAGVIKDWRNIGKA
eukprot:gnl/Spiro4/7928_TR4180_c0_g1_i1.p1 gnl/Spiro4/7928_TR4180_c0_g1~~gnl/Spiro4/7928_TR4180_c0_g1_i1.p1  ORF type:complete len:203 (-),score=15.94 gnl/Spiro4/7928_TR4180_c0_g1_i1:791-1399(-)